jgi:parallel beta-helix repeat protein
VSLIPPEPLAAVAAAQAADAAVRAPRTDTLVRFDPGVAHVELRGFVLEECAGTALRLVNAEHCAVADCTIRVCGDYAGDGVSVGGHGNAIVRCEISDTGSHGISLWGGDLKTLAPGDSRAEGNRISRIGVIHKQGCGVVVSGAGNQVVGNEIHDLPRFGVMYSGANLLVEGNRIERVSLETMDTAAIYGGSLDWRHGHGCVVRGNVVKDVIGRSGKAGEWKSPFFAWGIYLDWSATGMTVEGNTVVRCPRGGIMLHDGRDNTVVGNTIVDCGFGTHDQGLMGQIEASGWTTKTSWWVREYDNWCRQYDEVKDHPAWQAMKSFRDPRSAPLPDGRTMHGHVIERNILAWHAPNARPFNFRNLPETVNRCDHNLVWHFGAPIRTGAFAVKSVVGENLAGPNPGFEEGSPGSLPPTWTWAIRPSPADTAAVATDDPRSGRQCLRIEGVPDEANAAKEDWARQPGVRGADVAVEPGGVYRLVAWLRAPEADTPVDIGFTAYKPKTLHWIELRRFMVGPEWSRHEVIARIPERQSPPIDSLYLRLRLARERGVMFVDDVDLHRIEPLDEWAAWQAEGWDRHSIVADPIFVAADKGDYRLRDDSPARRLGLTSKQPGSTPPPAGPADRSPRP